MQNEQYPMPTMTEQDRQELIDFLVSCLENRATFMPITKRLRLNKLRNQIALASLT